MNVVFFIFNRPFETQASFAAIRAARPERLLVIADGPRESRPGEKQMCDETRAVAANIDWPCEVLRNYSDVNLGCGLRVSSGIDWAFSQVEDAIILEDDCVPDLSFFPFCSELLEKFRDDERVMMISGRSHHLSEEELSSDESYCFSQTTRCWGWATWRRAWAKYDYRLKDRRRELDLKTLPGNIFYQVKMRHVIDETVAGRVDTWDYQWFYTMSRYRGLCITPFINLVANVGFNERATHTHNEDPRIKNVAVPINFPLRHPGAVIANKTLDEAERLIFYPRSIKELYRYSDYRKWWREHIERPLKGRLKGRG
jgi:hypothetical protein